MPPREKNFVLPASSVQRNSIGNARLPKHSRCMSARQRDSELFRLELREKDYIANALLAKEHHAQTVNAHSHASGWRHPVLERHQEIFVELLLLAAGLVFEALALLERIVLFGVGGCDFLTVDATFKHFHCSWVLGRKLRQRNELFGRVRDESW